MIRDPLYKQIIQALDGVIDDDSFERCAQDLLRDAYPSLVPMAGGDDAGYDGAIGSDGGPYPLLSTVDRRGPLRNLRKNLTTYLAKRRGPKLAVIATPRRVTNAQKRRLEDVARREYGVQIVNIHEQTDFANRLYRDAPWRLELLRLSGRPSALSALPPRSRAERPMLVGREEDVAWLRQTKGDLLLVGQPGIGKTFLHEALVHEGLALFALDSDSERLADALRAQAPKVVVVDDAQDSIGLIETLRHVRPELGLRFSIHANCWPHAEPMVRATLQLPATGVRHLHPLTRIEVLALVKELGLLGPDSLLHLLLEQSEGKPGLATALVGAAKRGELQRVWSGEILAEFLIHRRGVLNRSEELAVLAAVSLAGDFGLSAREAAAGLQVTPLELRSTVVNLAAGGIIEEVGGFLAAESRLSVRPPVLRGLLAMDVFFKGAGRLDVTPLLELLRSDPQRAPGLASCLLAAKQRGADIDEGFLLTIVDEARSNDVWQHAGFVGGHLADMLIEQYPQAVPQAAEGLLRCRPAAALRRLLPLAAESQTSKEEVRRRIKVWVEGDEPGDPESIPRRRQLLASLREAVGVLGCAVGDMHGWALALVVAPDVDAHAVPPGDGRRVVIYRGIRPLVQLQEIARLWPDVVELCRGAKIVSTELRSSIENWCFPQRHAQAGTKQETFDFAWSMGARMLNDVPGVTVSDRAARTWVRRVATWADLDVRVQVDTDFHRLFGFRELASDWQTQQRRREKVLNFVGDELIALGANAAMAKLASLEREVADFGWHDGEDRISLYRRLARDGGDAISWARAAIDENLPAKCLQPFVERLAQTDADDARAALADLIKLDRYQSTATLAVLSMSDPPEALLEFALAQVAPGGRDWTYLLSHLQPAEGTMRRLLTHSTVVVRVHAALAEWTMKPEGAVRSSLRVDWHKAVLDARQENEHLLRKVLDADTSLGFEWAMSKIDEASRISHRQGLWEIDATFALVTASMNCDNRWGLIERMQLSSYCESAIEALMRGDPELFRRWLRRHLDVDETKRYLALRPLDRDVDETWERFALVALDEGVTPDELAEHTRAPSRDLGTWPFSAHYLRLMPMFERLAAHADHRLRAAGERGLQWVRASVEREQALERLEDTRGLH